VPESVIHTTVTLLIIPIAVIMVIGGIWGLYYLRIEQNTFAADLGLLSGLIVLFGALMKIVTTASRTELFGATAGYAAVLVSLLLSKLPTISRSDSSLAAPAAMVRYQGNFKCCRMQRVPRGGKPKFTNACQERPFGLFYVSRNRFFSLGVTGLPI
jgi:hypothetical protein